MTRPIARAMPATVLNRAITGVGFFVLAFGSIVGSGWVVAMGEWLGSAGPGGAILAFLLGGVVMALIAGAYAELMARLPRSGGEFCFVWNGIGPRTGMIVGWFILLHLVSFTAFEAFALCWFLEALIPPLADAPVLYHAAGTPVTVATLGIGVAGVVVITWFNCRGADVAVQLQRVITFGFIAISIALILIGLALGHARNLTPMFASARPNDALPGFFWTFATSLLFLSGFQATVNAVEERGHATSMPTIARSLVGAVLAAAAFYALILLAAALLRPWPLLVAAPLPAAAAYGDALPGAATLVLAAATISLAKTWNALHFSAARLVMALARDRVLPAVLERVDPTSGVPRLAILGVAAGTLAWLGMGRGAIMPIINMCTICVTIIMILSLIALWRLRDRQEAAPEFVLPGGRVLLAAAIAAAALAAGIAAIAPFARGGVPVEIVLLIGWALAGGGFVMMRGRHV